MIREHSYISGRIHKVYTVEGWNDATHSIVYADTLTEFNKYLKAASSATAQTMAPRTEVRQKAALTARA
ncbi:MAG: hypothetical protein K6E31_00765 [bacterium]|nr:hypothetical protein [bacterium]